MPNCEEISKKEIEEAIANLNKGDIMEAMAIIQGLARLENRIFIGFDEDPERSAASAILTIMELTSKVSTVSKGLYDKYMSNRAIPENRGLVTAYLSLMSEVLGKSMIIIKFREDIKQLKTDNSKLRGLLDETCAELLAKE